MAHHRDTSSDSQVATEDDHSPESSGDLSPSLPQCTRVLIVGNNRTKRALIGQKAMVKKAVGLGGWHLLVSNQCLNAFNNYLQWRFSLDRLYNARTVHPMD
jgi:hypothetical protein